MLKSFNSVRTTASASSYRDVYPSSVNITDSFSEELKMELYLHRHYDSQELLARFTASDSKAARPTKRLAIAKLLFGLDKTIEYAEERIKEQALKKNAILTLR